MLTEGTLIMEEELDAPYRLIGKLYMLRRHSTNSIERDTISKVMEIIGGMMDDEI